MRTRPMWHFSEPLRPTPGDLSGGSRKRLNLGEGMEILGPLPGDRFGTLHGLVPLPGAAYFGFRRFFFCN